MGSFKFVWTHSASEVFVTGTFDDWSKSVQLEKVGDQFEKTVPLGEVTQKIYYKFVVDGNWVTDHIAPQEPDEKGNVNNFLTPEQAADEPASKSSAEIMAAEKPTPVVAIIGDTPAAPTSETSTAQEAKEGPGFKVETEESKPEESKSEEPLVESKEEATEQSKEEPKEIAEVPKEESKEEVFEPQMKEDVKETKKETQPEEPAAQETAEEVKEEAKPEGAKPEEAQPEEFKAEEAESENVQQESEKIFFVKPLPATEGALNPLQLSPGEPVPDITLSSVDAHVTLDKESYEKADEIPGSDALKAALSASAGEEMVQVAPLPAENAVVNPVDTPDVAVQEADKNVQLDQEAYEKTDDLDVEEQLKKAHEEAQQAASISPLPATVGAVNPGEDQAVSAQDTNAHVSLDQDAYEEADEVPGLQEQLAKAEELQKIVSVNPLPTTVGAVNPSKDSTISTQDVQGNVALDQESYEKADDVPGLTEQLAKTEELQQTVHVSPLPATEGALNPVDTPEVSAEAVDKNVSLDKETYEQADALPGASDVFISSVGPTSTTAVLAGAVPLESKEEPKESRETKEAQESIADFEETKEVSPTEEITEETPEEIAPIEGTEEAAAAPVEETVAIEKMPASDEITSPGSGSILAAVVAAQDAADDKVSADKEKLDAAIDKTPKASETPAETFGQAAAPTKPAKEQETAATEATEAAEAAIGTTTTEAAATQAKTTEAAETTETKDVTEAKDATKETTEGTAAEENAEDDEPKRKGRLSAFFSRFRWR